jgi:asparagine synthase (glutamine-hydrolysing)
MPGIIGIHQGQPGNGLKAHLELMAASLSQDGARRIDQLVLNEDGIALGRVSLGFLNAVDQPLKHGKEDCWIVFHGELYGRNEGQDDISYTLERYVETGDRCIEDLNGIFHFCIYDRRTGQIKLFNDKFGLQPLYYSILPEREGFVFGGEVKAILKQEKVSRAPDFMSLADFFHYGQILGCKTLFRDILLLPPGSILTYDIKLKRASTHPYWDLLTLFCKNGSYNDRTSADECVSLFVNAIEKRSGNQDVLGLSLSAGLDSRAVLAGLQEKAAGVATYTLGLPGCADERLAARMAAVAKTDHEFVPLGEHYLQDFEEMAGGMVRLSDGMYHPHESTEMAALEYFRKGRFKILLRGHGGEIAKAALAYPIMAGPEVHSLKGSKAALDYVFNTTNLILRDVAPDAMFDPAFCDYMKEAPGQSLLESCGPASEVLAPPDLCIFYYTNEHIRRQVVSSLDIFRSQIEIRMPYVDADYVDAVLKLPVYGRNKGEIQHAIIKRCMPGLVSIPDSNTGAPLDAGPLRLFLTDKFTAVMKRLSITGFRHYTEFQKWHRERFREASYRIIFDDRTAGRSIYNMKYLKTVFDEHMSGQKERGHLLGTIVALELWYRMFVDK